jgi:hypothetical protein
MRKSNATASETSPVNTFAVGRHLTHKDGIAPTPTDIVPAFYIMRTGEIVTLEGYYVDREGNVYRLVDDVYYEVPQNMDHGGYLLINIKNPRLSTETGYRSLYVQRVMMSSFHGEDFFPTAVADHIDCNKQNNHISNLRWLTMVDNSKRGTCIPIILIDEDGFETLCDSITDAIKLSGLGSYTIGKLLKNMKVKGISYTARLANN